MNNTVEIVPLSEETLSQASQIANKVFPDEHVLPSDSFEASLSTEKLKSYQQKAPFIDDLRYWVAMEGAKVLGVTGLYERTDDKQEASWLGWFCVDEGARGMGVGSALLDYSIHEVREAGKQVLRLYTSDSDNEAAAQFLYESRGLKIVRKESDDNDEKILCRELDLMSN